MTLGGAGCSLTEDTSYSTIYCTIPPHVRLSAPKYSILKQLQDRFINDYYFNYQLLMVIIMGMFGCVQADGSVDVVVTTAEETLTIPLQYTYLLALSPIITAVSRTTASAEGRLLNYVALTQFSPHFILGAPMFLIIKKTLHKNRP